jgi:hypothetical protein
MSVPQFEQDRAQLAAAILKTASASAAAAVAAVLKADWRPPVSRDSITMAARILRTSRAWAWIQHASTQDGEEKSLEIVRLVLQGAGVEVAD